MSRMIGAIVLAINLAITLAGGTADAGEAPVVLRASPPLHKSIDGFPRIVARPGDAAATRINRALAVLDKRFLAAAADCSHFNAQRNVAVTLAGARFLSLVANDSWYCGAYPDTDTVALVFDLATGRPVDWPSLLPASLGLSTTVDSVFDGSRIGMIASKALLALYLSVVKFGPDMQDCLDVVSGDGVAFQAWPVARDDAVALQPANLPHVVNACAVAADIPAVTLRRMGAAAALLDDIGAAHGRPPPHAGKAPEP